MSKKGKTIESLENSKKIRSNFLFRLGIKNMPHSILYHDRSDKSIDNIINSGRQFTDNVINVNKNTKDRRMYGSFSVSGRTVRGKAALSRFPQNIGRFLVKFFCPVNGIVYDPFAGHNSRMQLTYEVDRSYIGVDISHKFMRANYEIQKILEKRKELFEIQNSIQLIEGNSNKVDLENEIADFTITSPPYWDLEYYGDESEQLGNAKTYEKFINLLSDHVEENHRILKLGSYCAWFINDFSRNKIFYPYHIDIIELFRSAGFVIHNICVIDLGAPISDAFVRSLINTKRFPKRHEYCIIGKKEGINQQVENHIQNLIKNE